jgi:hypothetical protein
MGAEREDEVGRVVGDLSWRLGGLGVGG